MFPININFFYILDPAGNRVPDNTRNLIHQFIQIIPVTSSHHSRSQNPRRQFLPLAMSTTELFAAYVDWMAINHPDVTPVKDSFFRTFFNEEYNLHAQ